jgi:Protein of unknown function DUF262
MKLVSKKRTPVSKLAKSNFFDDTEIAQIASEEEDQESSPSSYDVLTYPADFTLEVLVTKLKGDPPEIQIPGFQRRFVWTQAQASKLIESFLLGLPVPPIFVFTDASNNQQVVDGQQRLKSIGYFFEGYFGSEEKGRRPVFRLVGLDQKSPYLNLSYQDLEREHTSTARKLKNSVLRAFVIKQLNPDDNTSVFHVFERLNTGGTLLKGQEIRNCVYAGGFNDLLVLLNSGQEWRQLYGKKELDIRQRDIELILRFFSLFYNSASYKKPMKDFLSDFMKTNQMPDPKADAKSQKTLEEYREIFEKTATEALAALGVKPFHLTAGLNVAVFDAVLVAFARNKAAIPRDIKARYKRLIADPEFEKSITSHTTDVDAVEKRLSLATEKLFK